MANDYNVTADEQAQVKKLIQSLGVGKITAAMALHMFALAADDRVIQRNAEILHQAADLMSSDEPFDPVPQPTPEDLTKLVQTILAKPGELSRKIEAIKAVREKTGWGLRESKDFVDKVVMSPPPEEDEETRIRFRNIRLNYPSDRQWAKAHMDAMCTCDHREFMHTGSYGQEYGSRNCIHSQCLCKKFAEVK